MRAWRGGTLKHKGLEGWRSRRDDIWDMPLRCQAWSYSLPTAPLALTPALHGPCTNPSPTWPLH